MKEYIEKGELLENMEQFVPVEMMPLFRMLVTKQTTADVVEVVRCKDCKHYKPQTGATGWNCKTNYCRRCVTVKVKETDFCSYAERKEQT